MGHDPSYESSRDDLRKILSRHGFDGSRAKTDIELVRMMRELVIPRHLHSNCPDLTHFLDTSTDADCAILRLRTAMVTLLRLADDWFEMLSWEELPARLESRIEVAKELNSMPMPAVG